MNFIFQFLLKLQWNSLFFCCENKELKNLELKIEKRHYERS